MIPGFDLVQLTQSAGPIAALMIVAAIIFAENGLLIGFFFPGDSMLITLGLLIQDLNKQHSQLDINLAVLVLIAAAIAGSYVGYIFGKKIGPRLFTRQNSLLFKQENIQRAQEFYNRFGGKTIILARFVPIVRTFVPLIAGIAKMDSRQFMIYNILGGAIWISSITYVGYFLGYWLEKMGINIDNVLLPAIGLILLLSISPAIYKLAKDKKQRQALWQSTKREIKKVFKISE